MNTFKFPDKCPVSLAFPYNFSIAIAAFHLYLLAIGQRLEGKMLYSQKDIIISMKKGYQKEADRVSSITCTIKRKDSQVNVLNPYYCATASAYLSRDTDLKKSPTQHQKT